ncbi:MAG: DUF177 domain-containing protein [Ignavibacteria bacterium]
MTNLKINISNLQDGEHIYSFTATSKELEIETVDIASDVLIEANLYKTGNQFDLNVKISGKFKLLCDRCIEDYVQGFDNSFEVIYKFDFVQDDIENDDDDIKFIPPKTNYINLVEDVRDYIVLSVPMKQVPEEKDDHCTYCNKNITDLINIVRQPEVSPVWEKLIQAKSK